LLRFFRSKPLKKWPFAIASKPLAKESLTAPPALMMIERMGQSAAQVIIMR